MTAKQFHKNNVQFDYFSNNFLKFEDDFYRYSAMNIPLTFITDDILLSMSESQLNYFKLPASKAKDQRHHYFIFQIRTPKNNHEVRIYEYVKHVSYD